MLDFNLRNRDFSGERVARDPVVGNRAMGPRLSERLPDW